MEKSFYKALRKEVYRTLREKDLKPFLKRRIAYFKNDYFRRYLSKQREYGDRGRLPNHFVPTDRTFPEAKIAVYTVVTRGYDTVKEPIYIDDALDYYFVTDSDVPADSVWKKLEIPEALRGLSAFEISRHVKFFPDELIKGYDYTIYIDAKVRILRDIKPLVYSLIDSGKSIALYHHARHRSTYEEATWCYVYNFGEYRDIKARLSRYKKEGFPDNLGSFENGIMIRKSGDAGCRSVMETWWDELRRYGPGTQRDQIGLPYSLWKNGKDASYVMPLGNNFFKTPYFLFSDHSKMRFTRLGAPWG